MSSCCMWTNVYVQIVAMEILTQMQTQFQIRVQKPEALRVSFWSLAVSVFFPCISKPWIAFTVSFIDCMWCTHTYRNNWKIKFAFCQWMYEQQFQNWIYGVTPARLHFLPVVFVCARLDFPSSSSSFYSFFLYSWYISAYALFVGSSFLLCDQLSHWRRCESSRERRASWFVSSAENGHCLIEFAQYAIIRKLSNWIYCSVTHFVWFCCVLGYFSGRSIDNCQLSFCNTFFIHYRSLLDFKLCHPNENPNKAEYPK